MVKVAVNGFGRIGQSVIRYWAYQKDKKFDVVMINGVASAEEARDRLKYDTVYGRFEGEVVAEGEHLVIDGKKIKIANIREPKELPWKDLGVEIIIDSTGHYKEREKAQLHLDAGAKKVVITSPGKDEDITIVLGVNEKDYDPKTDHIISNASCTTNCLAPVAKVLDENFGIENGMMTTIHAYTNDQNLVDYKHKDPRRARAAALNMIPTTTGAAKAVALVLPQLKGKFNGISIRVPVPTVSLVDLVVTTKKPVTVEEVNAAFKAVSEKEDMKMYLGYSEEPLVSSDYRADERSSIVDALSTDVIGENMLKVMAWYDNEWGYSARVVDLTDYIIDKGL
jgi:glyceraldehyde 3-phosphate dehydrogenase